MGLSDVSLLSSFGLTYDELAFYGDATLASFSESTIPAGWSLVDLRALGVDPADEAIGRVAQSAEAGGKFDQSRARIGYDAYLVVGNMVMLCELEVATCEALVERLD